MQIHGRHQRFLLRAEMDSVYNMFTGAEDGAERRSK